MQFLNFRRTVRLYQSFFFPAVFCIIVTAISSQCFADTVPRLYLIDFESYSEQTEVSNQYASIGAIFSIDGNPEALPVIVTKGSPVIGHVGGSSDDSPMASGDNGLTDPLVDDKFGVGQDITIDFDPFITSIRMYIIDIDGSESVTVNAYNGTTLVDSMTKSAGNTGTGDSVSTEFFLATDAITRIVIDVSIQIGFSVDFITFTRPCEGDGCGRLIEISQESAPDADDFKDNVLGFLIAYPSISTAANFFAYDIPEGDSWNGQSLTPIADRSHLMIADTTDGLSLVVVHDRAIPDDPDGGKAEMKFRLENDPDGLEITVKDDPASLEAGPYTGSPGDSLFTTQHNWSTCCTDGIVLSALDGPWVMFVEFTDTDDDPLTQTIQGLSDWVAYSADGTLIHLALEEDRRVRIRTLEFFLPQDLNQDGFIDLFDFALFAMHWLEKPCVEPDFCSGTDFVPDGEIDILDLQNLLERWLSGY